MSEWQLIETAPKDGTFILLFTSCGIVEGYFQWGEWNTDTSETSGEQWCYLSSKPTHWMPLPEPPK